jgi:DNA primase
MEIQDIKNRLTLATVLNYYSLKPDKNLRLNCPFHEDKTPSLQVYYKTHTAYCFSSNCKTHGKSLDVIDFILHKENCTKAEAIQKAIELLGGANETSISNPTPTPVKPIVGRETILQNMFTYFKNGVHNSKPAQEYIKQRGLDATKIEVGYNTAQFHHGARKEETLINNCVAIGLLSPWGTSKTGEQAYKPFAKYCICFALKDRGNHITGLYFRSTENNSDQKHFYLKESTGLYPSYPNPETERLIIAESIIDTASLLQIEAITKQYSLLAAYGTNRLNDEMKTAIIELKQLKEIIFAFDNDEAGGTATAKYSKELKELLPQVTFSKIELPCKDVNETLIAHQPEIFLHLLENRTNLFLSIENKKEAESEASLTPIKDKNESQQTPIKSVVKEEVKPTTELNTKNPNKITYATETATY